MNTESKRANAGVALLHVVALCRFVAMGMVLAIAAAHDIHAQERAKAPVSKVPLDVSQLPTTRPSIADQKLAGSLQANSRFGAGDDKLAETQRPNSRFGSVLEGELRASDMAVAHLRLDRDAILSGDVTAVIHGRAEKVTAENVAEKADQNALFVARTGTDAKTITVPEALRASLSLDPAASAQQLSYEFTAPSAEAGAPLHLVALVLATSGLILDAANAAFRGEFAVALSNSDKPSDMRAPDSPIGITVTAPGASIQPSPLTIPDVGRWHPVTLTVPVFSGPTYRIAVSAGTQDTGNAIDLAVTRPTVQLLPSSSSITGWGIGETHITIRVMGLSAPEGYGVTLSHDGGYLDPAFVKLDAQGVATTALRWTRQRTAS